ncbi:MAG TPA: hybrid sensor histidine kinase/response regulator, partial [Noviherbaspirillum sp.]|nr:hybrid sensor histidine kinase/response regulator [Noviherbaspirillum sp.]
VHLERIVDDLLDTARMMAGKITLEKKRIDLAEAVGACLRALQAGGRVDGHAIRTALEPVWIDADPARIDQVVNNLLTNALKYTPAGGSIHASVWAQDGCAVFEVADDGLGMAPELLARVFDPFVQGERSLDRAQGGLGIGLTLVRKLVELHGGSVEAASAGPGMGSSFVVRLPLAAADSACTESAAGRPGRTRCVLLVEDNPDVLESTAAVLELADYRVIKARSGTEGLQCALAHAVDVAIVDVGLPDIDGYEVARRLRASSSARGIRLVALTGYGAPEDVRRALDAGFDTHLVKPMNLQRLLQALEEAEPAA